MVRILWYLFTVFLVVVLIAMIFSPLWWMSLFILCPVTGIVTYSYLSTRPEKETAPDYEAIDREEGMPIGTHEMIAKIQEQERTKRAQEEDLL